MQILKHNFHGSQQNIFVIIDRKQDALWAKLAQVLPHAKILILWESSLIQEESDWPSTVPTLFTEIEADILN